MCDDVEWVPRVDFAGHYLRLLAAWDQYNHRCTFQDQIRDENCMDSLEPGIAVFNTSVQIC